MVVSYNLMIAFLISMAVTVAAGFILIPVLRRIKAGQSIREDGPVWHSAKQGTPIMGGLMFITGTIVACAIAGFDDLRNGDFRQAYVLAFALVFGLIGFTDDYRKFRNQRNLGLTVRAKFGLQLLVSAAFILIMHFNGSVSPQLYIPFFNVDINIPAPVYYAFAAFVMVGTVNSVNITDGVDGLAAGVSIPVCVFFACMAVLWGLTAMGALAAALAGGLVAFLLFNFHPARIFMGDTGALFIGGAVCGLAFAMDMPLILIIVGIVYIVETASDIVQVLYFKITHGKRIFKMAPLHHHFELCGWSEYKLFTVYTLVSALFAVLGFFGARNRYI
ncbi:MAG: phospho-N-acetylmuramoyl-pentapeptide-transferase [Oscillospiraceae bacterium]|nr:phospho-N-acetylmuramoyl-pentapeptide-transferase [Oscillospiraceae bacterium]